MSLFGNYQKKINIKGFSLVELMVVMGITGILIMVTGFYFVDYRKNLRLREAAAIYVSDMKLAKQRALAENVSYKVEYDLSDDTVYFLGKYDGANITNPVPRSFKDISPDINFKKVFSKSIKGDNGIIIEPRGLSTEGYAVIQNKKKKIKVEINKLGRVVVINDYKE